MSKISPCLWFNGQAEEAANFYVSLLPDSRIDKIQPELDAISKTPESDRLMDVISAARKSYQDARESVIKGKAAGDNVHERTTKELIPAMEGYLVAIDKYAEHTRTVLQTARNEAQQEARTTRQPR